MLQRFNQQRWYLLGFFCLTIMLAAHPAYASVKQQNNVPTTPVDNTQLDCETLDEFIFEQRSDVFAFAPTTNQIVPNNTFFTYDFALLPCLPFFGAGAATDFRVRVLNPVGRPIQLRYQTYALPPESDSFAVLATLAAQEAQSRRVGTEFSLDALSRVALTGKFSGETPPGDYRLMLEAFIEDDEIPVVVYRRNLTILDNENRNNIPSAEEPFADDGSFSALPCAPLSRFVWSTDGMIDALQGIRFVANERTGRESVVVLNNPNNAFDIATRPCYLTSDIGSAEDAAFEYMIARSTSSETSEPVTATFIFLRNEGAAESVPDVSSAQVSGHHLMVATLPTDSPSGMYQLFVTTPSGSMVQKSFIVRNPSDQPQPSAQVGPPANTPENPAKKMMDDLMNTSMNTPLPPAQLPIPGSGPITEPTVIPTNIPTTAPTATPTSQPTEPVTDSIGGNVLTNCVELVRNGTFGNETGSLWAWGYVNTESTPKLVRIRGDNSNHFVQLGLMPENQVRPGASGATISAIYQDLELPIGAPSLTLSYRSWRRTSSPDDVDVQSQDFQQILLLDPATNQTVAQVQRGLQNDDNWQNHTIDLNKQMFKDRPRSASRQVRVYFEVFNSDVRDDVFTWMLLDDVSIEACWGEYTFFCNGQQQLKQFD
ncbi:MAG: hypothetical protein AAF639_46295 [Chloroflexota bacterium]